MIKMKKRTKIAGITVLSLLIVVMLIPAAIATPVGIIVYGEVTDKYGDPLEGDGGPTSDLVHLINDTDNSIICEIRIGEYYGSGTGKFYHTGETVGTGTFIYCRAWNAPSYEEATYSGDSPKIEVTGTGDYDFGAWQTLTSPALPPVPELPTIILLCIGLLVLAGYIGLSRKKSKGFK
ncbi:hypothetical protein DRN76_03975 [Methanosarcinales archaeon]|nr:MAG: hypothetical protein DRN76_03975 [Methanosarcinales archaeon]